MAMKLYSVYLPAALKDGLGTLARRDKMFEGDIVRDAISAHLKRHKVTVKPWQKGVTRVRKRR